MRAHFTPGEVLLHCLHSFAAAIDGGGGGGGHDTGLAPPKKNGGRVHTQRVSDWLHLLAHYTLCV